MKRKDKLKNITNSNTYKRIRILCVTGCCLNCKRRHRTNKRNWKKYRKTQYKN